MSKSVFGPTRLPNLEFQFVGESTTQTVQSKGRVTILGFLGLGLLLLGAMVAITVIQQIKSGTAHSCAASICMGLSTIEASADNLRLRPAPVWRILDASETDAIISGVARSYGVDTPRRYWTGNVLSDPWGHRYLIAVRRDRKQTEWAVWSKGPDGLSGTKDDVAVPQEASALITSGIEGGLVPPHTSGQ